MRPDIRTAFPNRLGCRTTHESAPLRLERLQEDDLNNVLVGDDRYVFLMLAELALTAYSVFARVLHDCTRRTGFVLRCTIG